MTKPFVPCLIVSKRWFLIGLLFQLPFFTVPSKPGHGIRLDLTKVDDRGLLAARPPRRRASGLLAGSPRSRRPPHRLPFLLPRSTAVLQDDAASCEPPVRRASTNEPGSSDHKLDANDAERATAGVCSRQHDLSLQCLRSSRSTYLWY